MFAQREAELVKNIEGERQGVEEEKLKVVKMKEDLEKERLRRAMGVNFHKLGNDFLTPVFFSSAFTRCC